MSGEDDGPRVGFRIGRILEQTREERGLSLHQAEQATKIRARYLKELERENFDVLPAVYVQGSLRTYADYLGLDSEALIRELKFRHPSRNEPQRPAYAELPKSGAAGSVVPAIGPTGAETRRMPEEKGYVAPTLSTGGNNLLYLGAAALLVFVLAVVAFVSTLATPGQPRISQIRQPLASQVPDGGRGGELANLPQSESGGRPPKRESSGGNAGEKDAGQKEQTEQSQQEPGGAQDSYAASTVQPSTAKATPTAGATQSTVPPVSSPTPPEPSPEPPQTEPAPPAAETPGPEAAASPPRGGSPGRRIVVAPLRGPVVVRRSMLPGRRPALVRPRHPVVAR